MTGEKNFYLKKNCKGLPGHPKWHGGKGWLGRGQWQGQGGGHLLLPLMGTITPVTDQEKLGLLCFQLPGNWPLQQRGHPLPNPETGAARIGCCEHPRWHCSWLPSASLGLAQNCGRGMHWCGTMGKNS